jgi:hypothetical protein
MDRLETILPTTGLRLLDVCEVCNNVKLTSDFYAKGALIYAQGAVFPTIPGKYFFPQSEGHVIITSD